MQVACFISYPADGHIIIKWSTDCFPLAGGGGGGEGRGGLLVHLLCQTHIILSLLTVGCVWTVLDQSNLLFPPHF